MYLIVYITQGEFMAIKVQFYANETVAAWLDQQTGGPTAVLNAALERVIDGDLSAAARHDEIMHALDRLCQFVQALALAVEAEVGDA
jgi:hypothetical protein